MHILLPSESQVREFDPKLLLACALAERGLKSIVGSRIHMHLEIERLPRGIYLAKDVRRSSGRIFRILKRLGNRIVALDEEGLVTLPQSGYLEQRIDSGVLSKVDLFFAWGAVHGEAIAAAPGHPGTIVPTGNPRFDLLRPELRTFYRGEAEALVRRHGRFVLVNSNFGRANPAVKPVVAAPDPATASTEGARMIAEYFDFRQQVFPAFAEAVPKLAAAIPDTKIVLRPHPAENFDTWRRLCSGVGNVEVIHEGYIAPWLLAAEAVVHNGCTTGIEAVALDRPCVAYRPLRNDAIEIALPNRICIEVFALDELVSAIRGILAGNGPIRRETEVHEMLARHVSGLEGALASDRIAAALERTRSQPSRPPPLNERLRAHGQAAIRRWEKRVKSLIPGHKNSRTYTQQRFPGVSLNEVSEKVRRFGSILGRFDKVTIRPLGPHLFEVGPLAH